jgi:GNAT superfamily N-acetyltransferase
MIDDNFTVRIASRPEVDTAIEWAATEGWNPGRHDADCYYAADSAGFLIGLLGHEPVATISAIHYGTTFGFIGFYIVTPQYRGKGYGIQIWNEALKKLAGRNVGLDGVLAQQRNYERSGFKLAYRHIRYEGIRDDRTPDRPEIIILSTLPFETIEAYDRPFFPADRSRFIRYWVNQPESISLGIMRAGKLAGYGVMRACRSGHKIGPLFADNAESADSLFLALQSRI